MSLGPTITRPVTVKKSTIDAQPKLTNVVRFQPNMTTEGANFNFTNKESAASSTKTPLGVRTQKSSFVKSESCSYNSGNPVISLSMWGHNLGHFTIRTLSIGVLIYKPIMKFYDFFTDETFTFSAAPKPPIKKHKGKKTSSFSHLFDIFCRFFRETSKF